MRLPVRAIRLHTIAILLVAGVPGLLGQVDVSDWPTVRMTVQALDGNGDPIRQLGLDAVVVKEGGQAQSVTELKLSAEPQSVCLLIDTSGSMYDRLDSVKATAARLLKDLPAEDEVCVADFSSMAYVDSELTLNRAVSNKSLQFIKASGGTAMYDAVIAMEKYMVKRSQNRSRAIVLLSDGDDNASKAGLDQMRRALESAGSPVVHLFRIPAGRGSGPEQHSSQEKAAIRIATMGGGLAYYPRNIGDMEASVDNLVDAMKSRYELTYTSTSDSRDGRERRLEIGLDKLHQKQKAIVRAPEGYLAPSS